MSSYRNNENKINRSSENERKTTSGSYQTGGRKRTPTKRPKSGSTEREKLRAGLDNFSDGKINNKDTYFERRYSGSSGARRTSNQTGKKPSTSLGSSRSGSAGTDTQKQPRQGASQKSRTSTPQSNRYNRETAEPPTKIKEYTVKQRKIRSMLLYIGLFLIIVVSAVVLSVTIVFKTDNIIVVGETPYDTQEIIDASGLYYGENIFLSRKKAAAKNIVDAFPYIESAEITFKIPGTQIITVEGAVPSYEVAVNGGYAIISSKGRVLTHIDSASGTVPLLKGVKVTDTEVGKYIKFEKNSTQQILTDVIDCINANEIPSIYGIDISNAADIKLNYDNRITISLGVPEDIEYKLRTAMTIINTELAATDKGDLDVSLANSERKSSYFTPIYSNTITIEDGTTSSSSVSNSSNEESQTE